MFVDADVAVHPDAFTRLRAAFAADRDLVAVYGSYDDSPADRATVSAFRNLLHHHVHQSGAGPAETFWTGLGAVRRSHFLAVGGFDEARYPHPSIEDIDFGHRLAPTGARDRPRPRHPGDPPQGVDAALDALDRLRPPRHPVGRAAGCATGGCRAPSTAAGATA